MILQRRIQSKGHYKICNVRKYDFQHSDFIVYLRNVRVQKLKNLFLLNDLPEKLDF